jgi:hypothetical protein
MRCVIDWALQEKERLELERLEQEKQEKARQKEVRCVAFGRSMETDGARSGV